MDYNVNVKDNDAVMLLMDGATALKNAGHDKFKEVRDAGDSDKERINWYEYRYLKAKAMLASLHYTFYRNRAAEAKTYTPDTPVGRAEIAVMKAETDTAKAEYTFAALVATVAEDAWRESSRYK